jgi:hypothetical protein
MPGLDRFACFPVGSVTPMRPRVRKTHAKRGRALVQARRTFRCSTQAMYGTRTALGPASVWMCTALLCSHRQPVGFQ